MECHYCKEHCIKYGKHASGQQKYYCHSCNKHQQAEYTYEACKANTRSIPCLLVISMLLSCNFRKDCDKVNFENGESLFKSYCYSSCHINDYKEFREKVSSLSVADLKSIISNNKNPNHIYFDSLSEEELKNILCYLNVDVMSDEESVNEW